MAAPSNPAPPERLLGRLIRALRPGAAGRWPGERGARHLIGLCRTLLSERGEVSGAQSAIQALEVYQGLDADGVERFFDHLVADLSPDPAAVARSAQAYGTDPSQANLVRLQSAVEPPRQELFRRLNMAPGATAALVELRQRLLPTLAAHPDRVGVDADLLHLFRSWFNRGFLVLRRIDWRTSALVLERLIAYEAVHQIQGWDDLRRRLADDRRCYAFFHPALADEPLIFIEVALTRGLAGTIAPLIDPQAEIGDPDAADCAIFYSITNCQAGLRGVSFGNFLIKQVAEDLGREFPRLRTFATLSPMPGFAAWLQHEIAQATGPQVTQTNVRPQIAQISQIVAAGTDHERLARALAEASADTRRVLIGLGADYLLHAKRGKEPLDPVARFHLANGARVERINWLGDTSPAGLERALGLMVNYVYRLDEVEANHEAYAKRYQVAASRAIQRQAAVMAPSKSRRA